MLKKILVIASALAVVALLSSTATAQDLSVGDPAPKIDVAKFVKGTPVTQFEKGKIYVVEFWATWCSPCVSAIPHLTSLAKKNRDVTFIGVSVFEEDQSLVAPFVEKMGDKMDYPVAMDAVPKGGNGHSGAMAKSWMDAAERDGIPDAFIINKEGKVAWIGHPGMMEATLAKIVAGTWDMKVATEKSRRLLTAAHKLSALRPLYADAYKQKDYAKVISILNDAIAKDPEFEIGVGTLKIRMLDGLGNPDAIAAYITHLTDGVYKDYASALNLLANQHIFVGAPVSQTPAIIAACMKATVRANELTEGKDPDIMATLAAAYFADGKVAKAIETQERAIALAKGTERESDPYFADYLAIYKSAK